MGINDNVYDPTDTALRNVHEILEKEVLAVTDFVGNPVAILLLLREQNIQLIELMECKALLALANKSTTEQRGEIEILKVDEARLKERENLSLIEIPASILTGFAISILTIDLHSQEGWLLLVLGIVMLLFLRRLNFLQIRNFFSRKKETQ